MISKLRFSLIAVILLVLLGFGFQNQANGQVGTDLQFCPTVEIADGWLDIDDITHITDIDFTAGLIGTVEGVNAGVFGGMDWMHVDFTPFFQPTPTNEDGAQIVTWWTQKNGRNTYVQLTNDFPVGTAVHVVMLDENCIEVKNFCDFYTGFDTHVYDLGDLVTNDGQTPSDGPLQDHEGLMTITAVDECPSPGLAIDHNALAATVQIQSDIDEYGFNAYHRFGVCFDQEVFVDVNLIENGSFQDGVLGPWSIQQGIAGVINSSGISPSIPIPPCQGPDCVDPNTDLFQAFAASDDNTPSGYYGQNLSSSSFPGSLPDTDLINTGTQETNVTIVQSNVFQPLVQSGAVANTHEVAYDLRFLAANDLLFTCDNYAAVCLVDVTQFFNGTLVPVEVLVDCDCYNRNGNGQITGTTCADVGDDNVSYAIGPHEFQGGASSLISGVLTSANDFQFYVVQFITGQKTNDGCRNDAFPRADVGALVDNFRNVETLLEFIECDGILTGEFNAFLTQHLPEAMAGQFNTIVDDAAASDAVILNFADEYLPDYRPVAAFISAQAGVWDEFEVFESCGDFNVCFYRLGIDADLPISEEFNTPTPSFVPTTPPPSTTPPTTGPTPPPSGNKGGGSCAIAGSPVQLGTAFANVLIPLVPVAFAFGVRAVRRRKK
jgi:hypothetical protein